MTRLSLEPVAAPVDRFAAPEVRQGTAGSEALQLAGALQRFNPALQGFIDSRFEGYKRTSEAEAAKIMAERQFKSMGDYKAAVDRGEIPEDANPWRTVFLKNMVARRQLTDLSASLEDKILQDPTLRDDDTGEKVGAFINDQLKAASQEFDAFQLPAAMAQADSLRGQAVERHLARRREIRQEMTQESITRSAATVLDTNRNTLAALADALDDGNFTEADGSQADLVLGDLQKMVGAAELSGVSDKDLKRWVGSTIANAAIREKSPELAKLLMDRIKVGGESLSVRLAGTGVLDEIMTRVEDEADRSSRRERESVAYARSEQYHSASVAVADVFNRGGSVEEVDAYLKDPSNGLTIEQQSRLRSEFMSLAGDQTVAEAYRTSMADPTTAKKLMEQSIKAGDVDMAKAYRQVYEWTNQGTTIEARMAIQKVLFADDQTFYNEVQKWGNLGQLDSRDIGYILGDRDRMGSEMRQSLNERRQLLQSQIESAMFQAAPTDENGRITPQAASTMEAKANRASFDVFAEMAAWRNTPEGQSAGLEGIQNKITEISEKVYAKTLGLTPEEIQDLPMVRELNDAAAVGDVIESGKILPVLEGDKIVYRMNKDGTPGPKLSMTPRLFKSALEVDRQGLQMGTAMGLKGDDLGTFLAQQYAAADGGDPNDYQERAYDRVNGTGAYKKALEEVTKVSDELVKVSMEAEKIASDINTGVRPWDWMAAVDAAVDIKVDALLDKPSTPANRRMNKLQDLLRKRRELLEQLEKMPQLGGDVSSLVPTAEPTLNPTGGS